MNVAGLADGEGGKKYVYVGHDDEIDTFPQQVVRSPPSLSSNNLDLGPLVPLYIN